MRIAVAMSGGVDSSVAAAVLKELGHDVVGITLKVWDESRCCSLKDADDARRVSDALGIPHFVLDAGPDFEGMVVTPFLDSMNAGLTPNPCVLCNRRLKFSWLADRASLFGCEKIATGHYARITGGADGGPELRRGLDLAKDQSYFVVPEKREDMTRLLFPLGGMDKAEVRNIASKLALPVAEKPESQDLCFIPDGDVAAFLDKRLGPDRPGHVFGPGGEKLGTHKGARALTIGQRKGLGVSSKKPLYVISRDLENASVTLAPKEKLMARTLTVNPVSYLVPGIGGGPFNCTVRTRSTGKISPCSVSPAGDGAEISLFEPQFAVTPGQLAVFYMDDLVCGSGWITGWRP